MSNTYLVFRQTGSTYSFRSIVPKDLQSFLGTKEFQLSLRCGILKQAKLLSSHLYNLSQQLYDQLRNESAHLRTSIDQIKEKLRSELAKLNPAITPNPKPEETKASNNQKPIEISTTPISSAISLAQLSAKFISAKNEAGYPSKTINGYYDTHKLAISVLGDVAIDSLTHHHGRRLVSILKKLPVNRVKSYSNLTIQQLLQLKNEPTISHKTILKHTERISTLFNWAISQGYTDQNVFRGKLEPIRKTEKIEKHFTDQEMNLILGEKLMAESLAPNKPERYWTTLISAYSGARLNEVCQLNISDIEKIDEIWAINFNADCEDKSVKTEVGNRVIPLHPKLLNLGLLDYMKQIKDQNYHKLFPNLKRMRSTGYGTMISRWFAKYLKKLGIKKKGKNFHSFRHTVVNKLTNQKVYEPFIRELIGHSHGSITLDVYGGRKPLSVLLNECVVKIGAC